MVDLFLGPQLGEVAPEEEKVRPRAEQIGLLDRPDQSAVPVPDEIGPAEMLDMGIRYVAEGEILRGIPGSRGHLHQAEW